MEEFPPSYQSAQEALTEYWSLVSNYIPSSDLCSASQVSRRWHAIFAPILWGNPAGHWGIENDQVYAGLTRFKRTLKWARLSVRLLTHTLHFPPAQAEFYDGPHAEWLRDVLEALPNLQSLIVPELPFFDHQALLALRSYSTGRQPSSDDDGPRFPLRLLIAAQCKNLTTMGLAEALKHLRSLVYVDLSHNVSARDPSVLLQLQNMSNLQVLRFRNCQFRDSDMEILGASVGICVRSLDVRGNQLTDASVRTLLHHCFAARETSDRSIGTRSRASSGVMIEDWADWPSGLARPDAKILDEFRDESLNAKFVKRLTTGVVCRLPSQDLRHTGLTHLYIADNHLSVEGVSSLIKSKQLCVLDVGHFDTSKLLSRPRGTSSSSPPTSFGGRRASLPGAEKLTPVLERYGRKLTYLRLHYSIVTTIAPTKDENTLPKGRDPKGRELAGDDQRQELGSARSAFELPTGEPAPRYELPGDGMHIVLTPAIGERPPLDAVDEMPIARRGSIDAPEVVAAADDDEPLFLSVTGLGTVAQVSNERVAIQSTKLRNPKANCRDKSKTVDVVGDAENQCENLTSRQGGKPHGLLPGMLPQLRTIVLTGVPCNDSSETIKFLINFIRACASEAEIAELQAGIESIHPNIPRFSHVHKTKPSARDIFGLQRIILEMGPPGSPNSSKGSFPSWAPLTPQHPFRSKSSTEDPDSEALWSAQENDFSFFDNDEECGLPAKEKLRLPLATLSEKVVMPADDDLSGPLRTLQKPSSTDPKTDVVQALADFRRDRKAAYENALRHGTRYVDGYWSGEVKIVRWHSRIKNRAD